MLLAVLLLKATNGIAQHQPMPPPPDYKRVSVPLPRARSESGHSGRSFRPVRTPFYFRSLSADGLQIPGQEMQAMHGKAYDADNRKQMREQMQADRMNRGGGPGMDGSKMKVKNGKVKSKVPRCKRPALTQKSSKPYGLELFCVRRRALYSVPRW